MADDEASSTSSDQESYYAVLNVPQDASAEDIKRAYRQLAQICHPDKTPDSVPASGAASNFMRIQEAYEVLSSEEKRTVYDVYGRQGLESGMELGECLRSPDELKKEYERFQAQRKAQKREASVAHRGAYIFKVDACEAMNPYDPDVDHTPELISVATTNSVQIPISEDTAASVGCQVAVRKRVGGGSFVCGVKRVLTPHDTLECHAAVGLKTFVSATATRHLGEHTSASLTSSWHPQAGLGMSLATSRQLTPQTEADLVTQFGPDSMVGIGVTHHGRKILISARLEAGASTGVVGKVVWQATASMSLRASAKLGTMGVELEVGGSHRVSEFSTAGCSVVAGLQGLILRPRFSRGGHVFEVPVMLSPSVQQDTHLLLAAYVVPPLVTYLTKYYLVLPLKKRAKVKKLMEARLARVAEVRSALEEASAAAAILEPVAMRKLRQEVKKGGLVILAAKYGAAHAVKAADEAEAGGAHPSQGDAGSSSQAASTTPNPQPADTSRFTPRADGEGGESDEDGDVAAKVDMAVRDAVTELPPAWLDVTTALRFLVKDAHVQFHKGLSKSGLMGFCDVALGEEKVLLVHYLFQNRPHTARIPDRAGQSLPEDGTLVTRREDIAHLQSHAERSSIPFPSADD